MADSSDRLLFPRTEPLPVSERGVILVNQVAFAALKSIEVIESYDHQHRPIRACFDWAPLCQVGEIHCKFAELDHTNTIVPEAKSDCQANRNALHLWNTKFAGAVQQTRSPESQWTSINDFCLETLTTNGAVWGFGERARGALPRFRSKKLFPGQTLPCHGTLRCSTTPSIDFRSCTHVPRDIQ